MPIASSSRPSRTHQSNSSISSRPSASLPKTEVKINVYDLLPPGRLSSILWTFGSSLLHSGVELNGKEYAYGGHNQRGVTGVYWTKPRFEPPGGTFRTEILHGFTFATEQELETILAEVSDQFPGTSYNLLTNNCNHFTSALCERLTAKAAPTWLNRAASIGLALPCVVPREWIAPPDCETADGELLDGGEHERQEDGDDEEEDEDEDDEDEGGETAGMLASDRRREQKEAQRRRGSRVGVAAENSLAGGKRIASGDDMPPARLVAVKDTSGRSMPVAERAPIPKQT